VTWHRLQELGRGESLDELNSLFARGETPNGLNGRSRRIPIA
jgi:hypothetical protein